MQLIKQDEFCRPPMVFTQSEQTAIHKRIWEAFFVEPLRIHHVGMRTFKTALATELCALIYYFVGRSPAFACIGVIFGMGETLEDSRLHGGNRLFGTIIGGVLGMLLYRGYLFIRPQGGQSLWLVPLMFAMGFGILGLCEWIKRKSRV